MESVFKETHTKEESGKLVCKGSLHQGEIESGGSQCTCIALVFLTLNDIPKSVQEVDNILHKGTTTYQSLARDDNVYFLITDFPDRVSIENEIFDLSVRNPISVWSSTLLIIQTKSHQNNPSPQCFEPMDTEHVANDNTLQDSDISVDGGRTDLNIQQNFDAIDVGNSDPLLLTDDQKHMLIYTSGRRPRKLVSEPYQNWKDAITDLKRHASSETHLNSIIRLSGFQETYMRPESRIDINTNARSDTLIAKNRQILKSLIKCLEFCGRRGLALRGHRDDDQIQDKAQNYNLGNYKELVKFRAEAGDSVLDDHLKQCAKNASYTFIQQTIVDEVKAQPLGPHFGYQCDEVSDASNWEQLGIVIRYLRDGSPVEKLLEFVQAEETTGSALCGLIVKALTDAGLDIQFCRARRPWMALAYV
ncbi:Hypothetical predicted protein, partial [Mytilus galloprovincialis]